jgi:hypothetical protein
MSHGTPDWGLTAGTVTTYQLTDLAELAARLGSIVAFDRRGEAIFLEDFRDGVGRWIAANAGDDGTLTLSALYSRSGPFSALLTPSSAGFYYVRAEHYLSLLQSSPFGLETSFSRADDVASLELELEHVAGGVGHSYTVRYDGPTGELRVYNSGTGFVTIATPGILLANATVFHAMKLVVNLALNTYERVILADTEYPLSGYTPESGPSILAPFIGAYVLAEDLTGAQTPVYLDDVILTQNEPV